ncbi:hypothetical protein [Bradyrhizobium pachyrhizi]|uniref:hypothetical protein n=1 Tax=Bradyrhizobium pachyrhizi TaxID=280333 RepID=UPI000A4BF805|nr:hypothetical protein [Bradyrhizobium pachyrhizi]
MSVLSQMFMTYVSEGGFTLTTFDPATLSNATLSSGNRGATRSNTNTGGAASTSYKSAGKYYWENVVGASHGGTDFVGIMAVCYGYFPAIRQYFTTRRNSLASGQPKADTFPSSRSCEGLGLGVSLPNIGRQAYSREESASHRKGERRSKSHNRGGRVDLHQAQVERG